MKTYSPFFQTIYDQPKEFFGQLNYGKENHGVHYSIFRANCWHYQSLLESKTCRFQDFAVIWDEDHDTRIIKVIEKIYCAGLIAPILFFGERKGFLSMYGSNSLSPMNLSIFEKKIKKIVQSMPDPWTLENTKITSDLHKICDLWALGNKDVYDEPKDYD